MYTEDEIYEIYRKADDSFNKLQLLQELTLKDKDDLVRILNKYGIEIKGASSDRKRKSLVSEDRFMKYYNLGWTDNKISKAFGASESTIRYWRLKFDLPTNYRRKAD